jgi:hypothetical protein
MKKLLFFIFLLINLVQQQSFSQVIFEEKIGTDEYSEYPSNLITTTDNGHIFSVTSYLVNNNAEQFATLYSIDSIGVITNKKNIIKEDTNVAVNYISRSFSSNNYIAVGSLKTPDKTYLWFFEFNSDFTISNEHKVQIANARAIYRTYIRKLQFKYYIAYEIIKLPYDYSYTKMLSYHPANNEITISDWELEGALFDFEKNKFNNGFLIGGWLLNRSISTIWTINQQMELISQYNDLENDIYHQFDLNWTYNNKLIHSGSHYDPDYELTRFMGIQILDSNMNAEHFRSFGEIGLWNFAGSNESTATYSDNTIYFTGTQGVITNPFPAYDNHIAIHKMDTTLNVAWSYLIGGDAYYMTRSINTTSDGGCIIAATRYDEALQNQENDVYLIAMGPDGLDTSIDDEPSDNEVVIYPNPGNNVLNLDIREKHFVVQLYNNTGQLVLTKENQRRINTSALRSGIYFYRIIKDGEILSSGKWVKR